MRLSSSALMELEKPFKTIEVVDSRTGNTCKVACMSCIRGHRTTSCGIPVCRTKLFWTVKRPGRPANTCTCALGATGRCKCVIATSGCPHRAKKGEKRTVDCRCDEQGRWCCMIEPEHWNALIALQKPTVDFYASPESMTSTRINPPSITYPPTPSISAGTPQTFSSLPGTPDPPTRISRMDVVQTQLNGYQSPAYETPRFGFMGMGAPLGNDGYVGAKPIDWQGEAPQAPRVVQSLSDFNLPGHGPVQNPTPISHDPLFPQTPPAEQYYQPAEFNHVTQSFEQMNIPPLETPQPQFQTDRLMEDYYNYQFPSAICQNCGLSGCTCRNCPALMQSSFDGSWAQVCSRKHVRNNDVATQQAIEQTRLLAQQQQLLQQHGNGGLVGGGLHNPTPMGLKPGEDPVFSPNFNFDELRMPDGSDPMNFNEFVLTDPEPPSHGCCCGGDT